MGVLIVGRGNQYFTEAKYEANDLHKILYIMC